MTVRVRLPSILLAAVALLTFGFASEDAGAQTLADLKSQIDSLQRKVDQLEQQQKQQADTAAKVETVTKGSMAGSFKVPGTNTSVKIGGYVKLDAIYDVDAAGPDFFLFPTIPLEGTAAHDRQGQTNFHARQTRVNLRTSTPTEIGSVNSYIEFDFFGTRGTETISNSHNLRLRHAQFNVGSWLFGQTWSTILDLNSYGETLDFNGPTGVLFIRQPQIRFTHRPSDTLELAVALENPQGDISETSGSTNVSVLDQFPDLVGRATFSGSWGEVSVGALVREFRTDDGAGNDDEDIGYGLALGTSLNVGSSTRLFGSLNFGDGIGRYLADSAGQGAAFDGRDRLEAQEAWGASIGVTQKWTPQTRSTIAYGHTHVDNDTSILTTAADRASANKDLDSLHVNFIWSPIKPMDVGIEYIYGRREVESGLDGDMSRIQASFKYSF